MRGVPRERAAISREASGVSGRVQDARAAAYDFDQVFDFVELEAQRNAETVAQRLGDHAGTRRRADERERGEVDLHRARRRAFADDEVELKILHRGIEDFFDGGVQAMDLVDEEDVARLQVRQDRGEVAGARDHRARGRAEVHAEFARDDLGHRGFAEARRARKQHVVERFVAAARGVDEDFQVRARLGLGR